MKKPLDIVISNLGHEFIDCNNRKCWIYREEKIEIVYDIKYCILKAFVFIRGKKTLAAAYNCDGSTEEFHQGKWCDYVTDTLLTKAYEKKALARIKQEEKKKAEQKRKFSPLDDSDVFELG